MKELDYKLICKTQVQLLQELLDDDVNLDPFEIIRLGTALISNYQKSKKILSSKIEVDGDWESVLELTKEGLSFIVDKIVELTIEGLERPMKVSFISLLSKIQYLDFQDETVFREEQEISPADEINLDIYKDLL